MAATHLTDMLTVDGAERKVAYAVDKLSGLEFDTIVCQGVSGIVFGSMLALMLHKPLTVVRKPEDQDNHSAYRTETTLPLMAGGIRALMVDDLMVSGTTVNRMRLGIPNWRVVGVYFYIDRTLMRESMAAELWTRSPFDRALRTARQSLLGQAGDAEGTSSSSAPAGREQPRAAWWSWPSPSAYDVSRAATASLASPASTPASASEPTSPLRYERQPWRWDPARVDFPLSPASTE
jgi:adenine/guanine phosphoribosyltransferase-like PRPP-binding protein